MHMSYDHTPALFVDISTPNTPHPYHGLLVALPLCTLSNANVGAPARSAEQARGLTRILVLVAFGGCRAETAAPNTLPCTGAFPYNP